MFVSGEKFKNENNTRKVTTDEAKKLGLQKEEFNISKSEIQNSVFGLDKEVVQGKKVL